MILKPVNKEDIKGSARVFFNSNQWKNTLVFFCFILLASGFWALQYLYDKFEFEVPIKVIYIHAPPEIALSDKLPQEITLRIQDKGSAYLNYIIKNRKQSFFITVDLETVFLNSSSYLINQAALRSLIDEKLFATSLLKSYSPEIIEIDYSQLAKKILPVTVNGTISAAQGYLFFDSIRIEPTQVIAYGNENLLDSLSEIKTIAINYDNINKSTTFFADLQSPEGIHLSIDRVKISAMVEEYTEKIFEIPVVCLNVPPNRRVHFFPSNVELSVNVGLSKYSQLSKSNFEIAVNYDDLKAKRTANCSLILTKAPLGLDSYRITPDVIEFLIEQKK